jgi:hypothetical protein
MPLAGRGLVPVEPVPRITQTVEAVITTSDAWPPIGGLRESLGA